MKLVESSADVINVPRYKSQGPVLQLGDQYYVQIIFNIRSYK